MDNIIQRTHSNSHTQCRWSLGVSGFLNGFYRDNVVFAGDDGKTVVYPLGRQLVFRDITSTKNKCVVLDHFVAQLQMLSWDVLLIVLEYFFSCFRLRFLFLAA